MPQNIDHIGIAQINTTVGDIQGNAQKIIEYISEAKKHGIKVIIFPEYALTGCPLGDILTRFPVVKEESSRWLKEIAKHTPEISTIIGTVCPDSNTSCAAILENGKIEKLIHNIGEYKDFIITTGEDYKNFSNVSNKIIINICASQTKTYKEKKFSL